jgi:hypothetical protein
MAYLQLLILLLIGCGILVFIRNKTIIAFAATAIVTLQAASVF